MPVTRSKVQPALPFKQRKSRTARTSLKESDTETSIKSHRSKSVPPGGRRMKNNTRCSTPSKCLNSSPRKRTHDTETNKENEGGVVDLPCSPAKISKSPLKATVASRSENLCSPSKVPRSPMKENTSPSKSLLSPLKKLSLHRNNQSECYNKAKKAFHTALPDRLLCRDKEVKSIQSFLHDHIIRNKPGSLYISGAPGTGKTACLKHILEQDEKLKNEAIQAVFINCMTVRQSQGIYTKILQSLGHGSTSAKDASKRLQKVLTSKGNKVLLVLDEIDHLDCKGQEVLYTMFEWPSLPNSRLVLVGIANALDLTDRILPRLQARPRCAPKLLHFPPYTKDQIAIILQDRLKSSNDQVMEPMAVQLCARKVAAVAGDIRKALDVCRRAVEVVESDVRSQTLLKPNVPSSPQKSIPSSPRKSPVKKSTPKKVGPLTISTVLGEVYGSRMSSSAQSQAFPLQQKIAVCTLLLMVKEGKMKEITIGKLHETYRKVCSWKQVPSVDQSEFLSLMQLIETRGIVGLKKSKEARQSKVSLRLNESDVEMALQDKAFLASILQKGLATFK